MLGSEFLNRHCLFSTSRLSQANLFAHNHSLKQVVIAYSTLVQHKHARAQTEYAARLQVSSSHPWRPFTFLFSLKTTHFFHSQRHTDLFDLVSSMQQEAIKEEKLEKERRRELKERQRLKERLKEIEREKEVDREKEKDEEVSCSGC